MDKTLAEEERKFLHDLSNPLSIVFGNLRLILAKLQNKPDSMPTEVLITKLEKTVDHFERANKLINERRNTLHKRSTD